MKNRVCYGFCLVALLILGLLPMRTEAEEACNQSAQEQEALVLGQQVLRLRQALAQPEAADSMHSVLELGQQQAAYVMVRGWLSYQLQADRSLLAGNKEPSEEVLRRVTFLQQAIRRLDLE
ncbi:MAG: hypothetical protein ACRCRW_08945 [Aeromonadaceae bacterium]